MGPRGRQFESVHPDHNLVGTKRSTVRICIYPSQFLDTGFLFTRPLIANHSAHLLAFCEPNREAACTFQPEVSDLFALEKTNQLQGTATNISGVLRYAVCRYPRLLRSSSPSLTSANSMRRPSRDEAPSYLLLPAT